MERGGGSNWWWEVHAIPLFQEFPISSMGTVNRVFFQ